MDSSTLKGAVKIHDGNTNDVDVNFSYDRIIKIAHPMDPTIKGYHNGHYFNNSIMWIKTELYCKFITFSKDCQIKYM